MFNNKSIFVSGGTGSFGKKFVEKVFKNFKPKKVIIYSRDEQKHFQLQKKWKRKEFFPDGYNPDKTTYKKNSKGQTLYDDNGNPIPEDTGIIKKGIIVAYLILFIL